jgi:hypothetical protein
MSIIILLFPCCLLLAEEVPVVTVCEWKAIIAYFPGTPMEVSEDWCWFLYDIHTHYNEDADFYLAEYYAGDDMNISIVSPEDELIACIDISEYAGDYAGYVFIMKDTDPLWCDYNQSFEVIEQADVYFYGEGE